MKVTVRVVFGNLVREGTVPELEVEVEVQPSESVLELKSKVAAAAGGKVTADDLLLLFGPNDRKIGRQYYKDPTVDEAQIKLEQYSLLGWIERFPHWALTGVAIQKAAATAEQKDPEQAVADARAKGAIPKINDLPAPWGPKAFEPPPSETLATMGYLPARYPEGFSPLTDIAA